MRRNLFAPRIAFSMLVLALLLTSVTTVVAVFTRPELPGQSGSLPVKAPNLPEFLQKAQAGGSLPVIVMLNVPFQSESQLSSAVAVDTQRAVLLQTQDALLARLPGYAPASVKKYHFIPAIALSVDATGLAALAADPQVANIEEDQTDRVELAQSVPLIGAPGVWISGYTGSGQVVAILDTGVDKNHTFLTGKVKSEACYSSKNATYGSTSICPGGANSSTAGNSAMPYLSGVCPANGCDHGTHVAGIAAGKDPEGLVLMGWPKAPT